MTSFFYFGTATTFDVISSKGEFMGGAIAPGIGISAEMLSNRAAQLPEVAIKKPQHIIGKNTVEGMQSGVVYGYIGLTEKLIEEIKSQYPEPLKVVSTGGLGRMIYQETNLIDAYDKDLTSSRPLKLGDLHQEVQKEFIPTILILQGTIIYENLELIHHNQKWLEQIMKVHGINLQEIVILYVDHLILKALTMSWDKK